MIVDMQRPPEIIVADDSAKLAETAARAIVDAALEAVDGARALHDLARRRQHAPGNL